MKRGDAVADVGAGTGKLSVPLAEQGAEITAFEPVEAMRERLRRRLPDAVTHGAAAGTCRSTFHRVLRRGGRLGLIWNRRALSDPVQKAISELIDPYSQGVPRLSPAARS